MERLGLVVHPSRPLERPLADTRAWAREHDVDVVQVPIAGQEREVAPPGDAAGCDLVVAVGGDGTALAALHAGARAQRPVLGVACGSLGALTTVAGNVVPEALDRFAAGDWAARVLPAMAVTAGGDTVGDALNDLVVVRAGASQITVRIVVDDELYVAYAGDGIVAATALGSSAYTLAAGGPVLAPGADGLVLTPLAPHGGCVPPLVVGPASRVQLTIGRGYAGARVELDGHIAALASDQLALAWQPAYATLVAFSDAEGRLTGLRRRHIVLDSPRVQVQDARVPAPS